MKTNRHKYTLSTISKCGEKLKSFTWWACSISSKNRFILELEDVFFKNEINHGLLFLKNLTLSFKYIVSLQLKVFITIFINSISRKTKPNLHNEKIILIKTFAYNNTDFTNFIDPFFGNLKESLSHQKILVLFEPCNCFKKSLLRKNSPSNIISIYDHIHPFDILISLSYLLKDFLYCLFSQLSVDDIPRDILKRVKSLYLASIFAPTTLHSSLFYFLSIRIKNKYSIKKFIYTYENNPWERMMLLALRDQDLVSIGYQHNVIPPASLNMFLGINENIFSPIPNYIFTTGPKTKEIIQQFSSFPKDRIVSTCALRYEYLHQISPNPRLKSKKLLVALEGVWQAASFVNYILKEIESLQEWDITLRCHPALPIEQLRKKFSMPLENFKNIHVSNNISLTEEIKNNFCILYWGSTVALEAIMLGRPVINISFTEVNFDPLFELSFFKRTWKVNDSLSTKLSELYNLADIQYEEEASRACSYIKDYFYPCTPENLENFKSDFIYFNN